MIMAKKKAAEVSTFPYEEPSTCIRMTKEKVKKYSVGDKVSITVSGEVIAIRKSYGDPKEDKYELEIKHSKVVDESEEDSRKNPIDDRKV